MRRFLTLTQTPTHPLTYTESHQHYIFTNGRCLPNWDCKEQLRDLEASPTCQRPENYNDREVIILADDVTVPTVAFGKCGDYGGDGGRRLRRDQHLASEVDVTFRLNTDFSSLDAESIKRLRPDMQSIAEGVWSVAGGGVFGVPGDNRMKLRSGSSSVYEWSTKLKPGSYKYVFINSYDSDMWSAEEVLKGRSCVDQAMSSNQWLDRDLVVTGEEDTMEFTFCFSQCDPQCKAPPPVQPVKVTFKLDMALVKTVQADNVYVSGGASFGVPGDEKFKLTPVETCEAGEACHTYYTGDFMLDPGTYYYTYSNGVGPDWYKWLNKEDLTGQSCSANQYNDRQFTVKEGMNAMIVDNCFAGCGPCDDMMANRVAVTFLVDLGEVEGGVSKQGVSLAGGGTFGMFKYI